MADGMNIDGYGHKRDRHGVKMIQRADRKAERVAAAQERRNRRAAKRAGGDMVILLYLWPKEGITAALSDGAYIHGGSGFPGEQYQLVVIGELKASIDDYRAAVAAWTKRRLRVVSSDPLPLAPAVLLVHNVPKRPFLNIILEPETT